MLTATIEGQVFSLKPDLSGYRWFYSNGTPTPLWRATEQEAQRAICFHGIAFARFRPCPICNSADRMVLFSPEFERIEGAHLLDGYDVVACTHCGFTFADKIPAQSAFDEYYRD